VWERDKERERDRERKKERESEIERKREREREREREKEEKRERERARTCERTRERHTQTWLMPSRTTRSERYYKSAIKQLRTRSVAVHHWRDIGLSAYERDLVKNE